MDLRCKDCKYVKRNMVFAIFTLGLGKDQWEFAKCHHDASAEAGVGQCRGALNKYLYCSTMRKFDHLCKGKFFERRKK